MHPLRIFVKLEDRWFEFSGHCAVWLIILRLMVCLNSTSVGRAKRPNSYWVKAHLHLRPIPHYACTFTKRTNQLYSLKWASLMQNHSLKSMVYKPLIVFVLFSFFSKIQNLWKKGGAYEHSSFFVTKSISDVFFFYVYSITR